MDRGIMIGDGRGIVYGGALFCMPIRWAVCLFFAYCASHVYLPKMIELGAYGVLMWLLSMLCCLCWPVLVSIRTRWEVRVEESGVSVQRIDSTFGFPLRMPKQIIEWDELPLRRGDAQRSLRIETRSGDRVPLFLQRETDADALIEVVHALMADATEEPWVDYPRAE